MIGTDTSTIDFQSGLASSVQHATHACATQSRIFGECAVVLELDDDAEEWSGTMAARYMKRDSPCLFWDEDSSDVASELRFLDADRAMVEDGNDSMTDATCKGHENRIASDGNAVPKNT